MARLITSRTISTLFLINLVGFILFFSYLTLQTDNTPKDNYPANNAYITFTNNDAYAKGVAALAMSLMEVGSVYPLVVMITKDVSPSTAGMLGDIGCMYLASILLCSQTFLPLLSPLFSLLSFPLSSSPCRPTLLSNTLGIVYKTDMITLPAELSLQTERWGPAFTKIVSWKKTEFNKLMFLDSDLLVIQNVDYLFDKGDTLLATVDADASSCEYVPSLSYLPCPSLSQLYLHVLVLIYKY